MAYTQEDLDRLDRVLAGGTEQVRNANGEFLVYRDQAQLLALRARMVADLGAAAGAVPRRRVSHPAFRAVPSYLRGGSGW